MYTNGTCRTFAGGQYSKMQIDSNIRIFGGGGEDVVMNIMIIEIDGSQVVSGNNQRIYNKVKKVIRKNANRAICRR